MHGIAHELRAEWKLVALGLLGVAGCYAVVQWYGAGSSDSLPVALLLIPVMAVALWAGPWSTGITAAASVALGTMLFLTHDPQRDLSLRYAALILGCALATALAAARRRREDALSAQRTVLAMARRREEAERLMSAMLERLPELSGAATVDDVAERACRLAREVFGSDVASY